MSPQSDLLTHGRLYTFDPELQDKVRPAEHDLTKLSENKVCSIGSENWLKSNCYIFNTIIFIKFILYFNTRSEQN